MALHSCLLLVLLYVLLTAECVASRRSGHYRSPPNLMGRNLQKNGGKLFSRQASTVALQLLALATQVSHVGAWRRRRR